MTTVFLTLSAYSFYADNFPAEKKIGYFRVLKYGIVVIEYVLPQHYADYHLDRVKCLLVHCLTPGSSSQICHLCYSLLQFVRNRKDREKTIHNLTNPTHTKPMKLLKEMISSRICSNAIKCMPLTNLCANLCCYYC